MVEPKDPKEPTSAEASDVATHPSDGGEAMSDKSAGEDKVAQAYENISRKLEKLRSGEKIDAEEPDEPAASAESSDEPKEPDLEEWKGPKGVKSEEKEEEGEMELRRVKLKNLEEPDESKEAEEDEREKKPQKKWKPREGDPLDDEFGEPENPGKPEDQKSDRSENPDSSDNPSPEPSDTPIKSDSSDQSENPDTLDDLAQEDTDRPAASTTKGEEALEDKEDDYDIPNLKGSRQRADDMEYNTPLQTETFAGSYRDKSSMENNDPNNFFSQHNQSKLPKKANKFHLLILVVIGIAVIGFTVYILKGGFGAISINPEPSPSPSEQTSSTPTPTPTPEPERSKYKVRVLNGSGKTGLAKTVSDKLKELGYQIDKTGNATNSAFTQTVVRVKTEAEPFIPQVVKDLAPEFDGAGNTSLKDADTVDIEIILGAK